MAPCPNSVNTIPRGEYVMSLFERHGEELLPTDGSATIYDNVLNHLDHHVVLSHLIDDIPWQSNSITMFGKQHLEPRRTAWFGDDGAHYTYSGIQMTPLSWTEPLLILRDICQKYSNATFNSVLLNLYRDGHDKMGWHADNEPELGLEPVIASLSLGATRRFRFRHRSTKQTVECELTHGSLLVMRGMTQRFWIHEIPRQTRVTEPRVNLTFRKIFSTEDA